MALVQVLWGVSLLLIVASSLMATGVEAYRQSRTALKLAEEALTIEAATNRAILGLLDARPHQRWQALGEARTFTLNSLTVRITVEDELGRIDLNHAERMTLVSLLRSAGMDTPSADVLSDKLLDWREPRSMRSANGAGQEVYAGSGLFQHPRNGPFQSVDELMSVAGMTKSVFNRIDPALTVYSGRQWIDPQVASRQTLAALPGMTEQSVQEVIASRVTAKQMQPDTALAGRAFRVQLTSVKPATPLRDIVIRLVGVPWNRYWIMKAR